MNHPLDQSITQTEISNLSDLLYRGKHVVAQAKNDETRLVFDLVYCVE